MPKNSLKLIEKNLLYSRKKVRLPDGEDRRKKIIMKDQMITLMKEFKNMLNSLELHFTIEFC